MNNQRDQPELERDDEIENGEETKTEELFIYKIINHRINRYRNTIMPNTENHYTQYDGIGSKSASIHGNVPHMRDGVKY